MPGISLSASAQKFFHDRPGSCQISFGYSGGRCVAELILLPDPPIFVQSDEDESGPGDLPAAGGHHVRGEADRVVVADGVPRGSEDEPALLD
ncbi:hypothetical protein [Amycolatopsis sp. cmx-11-51]|uniref:hypothetical protein n=1 Tax=Amycolatopsis sp. cmx-11-51 TaxID=2785797 RepID=UPI0039E2BCBD